MTLGAMHHLELTVTDMARSVKFYDAVLDFLGYRKIEEKPELVGWAGKAGALFIAPANPKSANKAHDRYSPGLHHFAWAAESRAEVDRLHGVLKGFGARILDAPAEYDYMPGYYAVFFADPDGMKLELVHTPGWPPKDSA
ncbi:MAG: VOC family protein [Rhodospirillales bacterium]|nr:VOC family protein [Rhodospirillales bacterium]